jgi:hypothetical protein
MIPLRQAVLAATIVVLVVLLWGVIRLGSAQAVLTDAEGRERGTAQDLDRLERLRAHEAHVVARQVSDSDLISHVQQALTAAGLQTSAFSGIQPLGDQLDPISHVQQHTVQLHLNSLAPAELGAWLAAWLTPDQPWRVQGLALAHPQDASTLDVNRFAVTVTLLMRSLEDSP